MTFPIILFQSNNRKEELQFYYNKIIIKALIFI